jgi:arabinose-5-phosphate isomerase
MVMKGTILAISKRRPDEILKLLPHFKRHEFKLIVMTGKPDSTLAQAGDVVLDVGLPKACSLGLAPTASTTAALAMGDALAWCCWRKGDLRKRTLRCAIRWNLGRKVAPARGRLDASRRSDAAGEPGHADEEALFEITSKRLGVTGVVDSQKLVGVITDGDLRRALERHRDIFDLKAKDLMTRDPKTITAEKLAAEAVAVMERYPITSLFVLKNGSRTPLGVIHLHDLVKSGLV